MDFYPRGPFSGSGGRNPAVGWNRGPEGWIRPICGWVLFRFRAGVIGMGGKLAKKGVVWGNYAVVWAFRGSGGVREGGVWGGPGGGGLGGSRGGSWTGRIFGGLGGKNLYRRENACKNGPFSCFCVPGTGKTTFLAILDPFLGLGPLRDSCGSIGLAILGPWKAHFGANLMGFRDPGPLRGR